jgi:hypothetical protein
MGSLAARDIARNISHADLAFPVHHRGLSPVRMRPVISVRALAERNGEQDAN